jgi:hypothetical protein
MRVSGAWMIQRGYNLRESLGLRKPSTWAIEGGYPRLTRGESVDICSTGKSISEQLHEEERHKNTRVAKRLGALPCAGKKKKEPKLYLRIWKRKSVFWHWSYWHILGTPHNLDLMHITMNVCKSLLGTLLNMPEVHFLALSQGPRTCPL